MGPARPLPAPGLWLGTGRGVGFCVMGRRRRLFVNRFISSACRPRPYQVASGSLARNRSIAPCRWLRNIQSISMPASKLSSVVPPIPPPGPGLNDLLSPSDKTGFPEHACRAHTGPVTLSLGPVSPEVVRTRSQAMLTHLNCQGSNKRVGVRVEMRVALLPWTR